MVFVFPQNRIVIAIVLLIYIYRLSHWATLCVVGTGKNFSSYLRNTEKDQAQIHQRFFHQSQISNGNFSFKQHFCRKMLFSAEGLEHQHEVRVDSEILQLCLRELRFISFSPALLHGWSCPGPNLSRTLGRQDLLPRLWSEQGSLKGGTAWPWTNPAGSGKLSQDGSERQKETYPQK